MTTFISEPLLSQQSPQSRKNSNYAMKFVRSVEDELCADIKTGKLVIPESEKSLRIVRKEMDNGNESTQKRLDEIQNKKQAIKRELEEIKNEEEIINSKRLEHSRSRQKYFISKMTQQDKDKLKALRKAGKRFEKELEHKTEKYVRKIKMFEEEDHQAAESARKERLRKKQQIERSMESMEKRREEQLRLKSEEDRKLQLFLQEKKLYEKMQQKWKETEQNEQKKKQEMKEQWRKIRKVDFDEIKQHQRKYEEAMREQRQSRLKNSMLIQTDENSNLYYSRFFETVKEEKQKIRLEEEAKKIKVYELSRKKKEYGQIVRVNHKPTGKHKDDKENKSPELHHKQPRSLSLFEAHQKGTEYMRTVNERISEIIKYKPKKVKQEPKAFKYTNYLAELKKSSENKRSGEVEQIERVMRDENMSEDEKLRRARDVIEKIEKNKGERTTDKVLLKSVNAKLAILQELQ